MHPVKVNACACGRPAVVNRTGKLMCRECAVRDAGRAVEAAAAAAGDPILDRKREAEAAAFVVLAMEAGHRKARADWREQYADLLPTEETVSPPDEAAEEAACEPESAG